MHTLREQPERWRSADLPHLLTRREDGFYVLRPKCELFRHLPRKQLGILDEETRRNAIVVRRRCLGHCPTRLEGAMLRAILEDLGFWSYNEVARRVEPWANGDPAAFIARAVNDRGALLSVLIRVRDER